MLEFRDNSERAVLWISTWFIVLVLVVAPIQMITPPSAWAQPREKSRLQTLKDDESDGDIRARLREIELRQSSPMPVTFGQIAGALGSASMITVLVWVWRFSSKVSNFENTLRTTTSTVEKLCKGEERMAELISVVHQMQTYISDKRPDFHDLRNIKQGVVSNLERMERMESDLEDISDKIILNQSRINHHEVEMAARFAVLDSKMYSVESRQWNGPRSLGPGSAPMDHDGRG